MVYKEALLIIAIIFIVAGVVILFVDSFPESGTIGIVVLAIGLVILAVWVVLLLIKEVQNR